jgi:TolA-binding protein
MFGAGDLESEKPYGLTSAEKVIVKNKKIVAKNEKKIKKADSLIQDLNERIDGLESLFEGEGSKLNKVNLEFKKHRLDYDALKEKTALDLQNTSSYMTTNDENLRKLNEEIFTLKEQVDKNTQNIQRLKESFDKIVLLVNEINSKYVTKKEFNKLISILDKREAKKAKKATPKKKSNKQLMKEVRILFKKDHFTKAIPILEHLISAKHRPAECNYYLGEINYYRKNYKDALHYFKTSMTLYDKAKYLPKLLLHSAISFDKLGDEENAQNFYNTIVDIYPDTKEAKEASKKIK